MAFIGYYDKKFLTNFLNNKERLRNEKRIEALGMGENDQWIVDVESIVQRIPTFVFYEDESFFITILIDAVLYTSLEEIFHGFCNLSHQEMPLELDFFYAILKKEQEFILFKKTDIYKFFRFMVTLGHSRMGHIKGFENLTLNEYNSMVSEEYKLDKKLFYRYMNHYLKLLIIPSRKH